MNHMGARVELEEMAMTALTYSLDEGVELSELREEDQQYLSDDYKRDVLQHMSILQLIDSIMINPTVHISPSYRDTGLSASYTFQPLSNLVYTRDQQITTCKGIVMGRLRSSQRQLEVEVMKFCFRKLGARVLHAGYVTLCATSAHRLFLALLCTTTNSGSRKPFTVRVDICPRHMCCHKFEPVLLKFVYYKH